MAGVKFGVNGKKTHHVNERPHKDSKNSARVCIPKRASTTGKVKITHTSAQSARLHRVMLE